MKQLITKIVYGIPVLKCLWEGRYNRREKKLLEKRIKVFKERGIETIQMVESALSKSGLEYFATCGTLLGLIRENRLLRNDYDMDYGVLIREDKTWSQLENTLKGIGFSKIRCFTLNDKVTEQSYANDKGMTIDFFGHFIEDEELCFYSFDKIDGEQYPADDNWSAYILRNGKYCGVKKIDTEIGTVTVPVNAEEYLTYNYNDNWMIPDPNFKANTGKGCSLIKDTYGIIHTYE